jgi:hypothetical protein
MAERKTYFLQCLETGRVKIGRTLDVARRYKQIQSASPTRLELLGQVPNDIESVAHTYFTEYRLQGEWYWLGPRLLTWLHDMGMNPYTAGGLYDATDTRFIHIRKQPHCPRFPTVDNRHFRPPLATRFST